MQNYQSESLIHLIPALLKTQLELEIAPKSKKTGGGGRSWKYADWPTIIEASRPALAKHDLCVSQRLIDNQDGSTTLSTLLMHISGEYLDSRMRLLINSESSAQDVGSCMTYFKRYSYAALLGIVTDDEDDDAQRATEQQKAYNASKKFQAVNTPLQKSADKTVLSDREIAVLEYEFRDAPDLMKILFEKHSIQSLKDLPAKAYEGTLKRVREIKQAR